MIENRICVWSEDDDGLFHTMCGNIHEFLEGGPLDNMHVFCPYCGARLLVEETIDET